MSVTIREATKEDGAFLGWVVLQAARSHLESGFFEAELVNMTEKERINILREIVVADESSFMRWDGFLIAEVDGVPAAALSGYSPKEKSGGVYSRLYCQILRRKGWSESQMEELHRRNDDLRSVWPDLYDEHNHWVVEWVATKPEYRRRGLLNQLLQQILDIGRGKGFKKAQVSAMIGNEAAIRAYEKFGFTEYNRITSPLLSKHLAIAGIVNLRAEL